MMFEQLQKSHEAVVQLGRAHAVGGNAAPKRPALNTTLKCVLSKELAPKAARFAALSPQPKRSDLFICSRTDKFPQTLRIVATLSM